MNSALIVPDIHLKPEIFDRAEKILESGQADFAVQLGDLVDDWQQDCNIKLYAKTLDRAIQFAEKFPKTLWCYGNHDLAYVHGMNCSGYSYVAQYDCENKLRELYMRIQRASVRGLISREPIAIVHLVNNVMFSHAGVTEYYVKRLCGHAERWKADRNGVLKAINEYNISDLWYGETPVWARPQDDENMKMYLSDKILQVVGHTPVEGAILDGERNLLSTDTFSTFRNGTPFGDRKFVIVDTETQAFRLAKEGG